jgi:hypothetical protein
MLLLTPSVSGLFKWRQFEPEVILLAVGWYLRFSLSYREVEELLAERGLPDQGLYDLLAFINASYSYRGLRLFVLSDKLGERFRDRWASSQLSIEPTSLDPEPRNRPGTDDFFILPKFQKQVILSAIESVG